MTNDYPGYIYLRNTKTGEIHREDAAGRSHEQHNMDDMVEISESDALLLVAADPKRACSRCWPKGEAENVLPI